MKEKEKSIQELLEFSIINIDKPAGPTSFTVSEYILKQFKSAGIKINKTSHFGTLDPQVTGVLPIALGRACKLTGFFLGHDKEYMGILHTHKEQNIEKLQEIINQNFLGKIKQTPPIKSAVKRQEREREVKKFELIEKDDKDFLVHWIVEGGTYIRKLCSDLGEHIGGAHMLELRRTRAGIFDEKRIYNLNEFTEAINELKKGNESKIREMILPAEQAIKEIMPFVYIKEDNIILRKLLTGKPLFEDDLNQKLKLKKHETFSVFSGNRFVEIAEFFPSKPIIAKPLFVYD